jgi:hypothetical protein
MIVYFIRKVLLPLRTTLLVAIGALAVILALSTGLPVMWGVAAAISAFYLDGWISN